MKRWVFNALAGMSLLLCLAAVVLWVRSYWVGDLWVASRDLARATGTDERLVVSAQSIRGTIEIGIDHGMIQGAGPFGWRVGHITLAPVLLIFQTMNGTLLEKIGLRFTCEAFSFIRGIPDKQGYRIDIDFPDWLVAGLLLILPAVRVVRVKRRREMGQCRVCGYDLRATPERCPECGTVADEVAILK